jgi:hypothetical protein
MKPIRMKKLFDDSNLPYGTLEKFGLSQEMIEDLPLDVLEVIQDGGLSPVLPVSVQISPEESAEGRTRFQFVAVEDGKVDVLFYPLLEAVDLDRFPQADQEKLQAGRVQTVKTVGQDGTWLDVDVIQLDPDTRQVMRVPASVIANNIQLLAKRSQLTEPEVKALTDGETVTFEAEDDTWTVGIDLFAKSGLRMERGDEETWRKSTSRDWQKYNFGVYGCWVMNDDGTLDYVHDEDYTEEMWNEQKKQGLKQAHARTL